MAEKTDTKPTIKKTSAKPIGKKTPAVKSAGKASPKAAVKATATATTTPATTNAAPAEPPKLTQGQKLLKSMTAQKAAKKALMKGVAVTHVSFDDEGNEANVETVIQKITPPAKVVNPKKTNKNRPAVKKPEPIKKKKRSADEMEDTEKTEEQDSEKLEKEQAEEKKADDKKDNKKPPKKAKKPKKTKVEIEELKKDNKQEEALAYVRLFVNDRDSWKFRKVQQIWLLSNLYEIPEDEFDNVLEYLKDLQGSAREKTKQEAKDKLPVKKVEAPAPASTTLTYANVNTGNDDDDFDAEKLLAQATAAPVVQEVEEEQEEEEQEEEEESAEVKRAKLIIEMLS